VTVGVADTPKSPADVAPGVYVFVYGTLTEPERVGEVLDSYVFVGPAVLDGLHAVHGEYPTLAPGGEVGGRLLRTPAVAALDAYERVDDGLYVRERVPFAGDSNGAEPDASDAGSGDQWDDATESGDRLADGATPDAVAVYVGDPERLGADADWPGRGSFGERVARYLDDHEVVVRPRE
jgi:gamma-glutamylcyclotransferase (GGCT)/AIG2-like uncharacterized protein YtfP